MALGVEARQDAKRGRCENCHGGHEEPPAKGPRGSAAPAPTAEVLRRDTVASAAAVLGTSAAVASLVPRALDADEVRRFDEYLASGPRWPRCEDFHPLEATWDRVAVIDFSRAPAGAEGLQGAIGYGAGLPPRFSPDVATADAALEEVASVLPADLAARVVADARTLVAGLRTGTGRRQYKVILELVRGDTCQKWHCDQNISRALVTYVGPGTHVAREAAVSRAPDGTVDAVREEEGDFTEPANGDFLLMKGGTWTGCEGLGAAHRAPKIGPVPECSRHRLVLKTDILEDF